MAGWEQLGFGWVSVWCFFLMILSAVFPLVNAEIIILTLAAIAGSSMALIALVVIASTGQMLGKCFVYRAGRDLAGSPPGRLAEALERWRERTNRHPWSPFATVLLSSIVGLPPFYLASLAAGALRVNFAGFLLAGACGRLIRFGTIAFVPGLISGLR